MKESTSLLCGRLVVDNCNFQAKELETAYLKSTGFDFEILNCQIVAVIHEDNLGKGTTTFEISGGIIGTKRSKRKATHV